MKKTLVSTFLVLFLISGLYLSNTFAQDYARWGLPEGAKARPRQRGDKRNSVFSRWHAFDGCE